MKVRKFLDEMKAKEVNIVDDTLEIQSAYCGDFLSYAISSQEENCIWFTIMNNVNVLGVATLTDCSLIVLCSGVLPDESMLNKAKIQGINICAVEGSVYETAVAFSKIV